MTIGVRAFVNACFANNLPRFRSGELTAKAFRALVMQLAVQEFGVTVASAATHYNHSLKTTRAADPAAVEGLGRPEDKKGGRPVVHPKTVMNTKTGEIVGDGLSKAAADNLISKGGKTEDGKPMFVIKVAEAAPVEATAEQAPESAPVETSETVAA